MRLPDAFEALREPRFRLLFGSRTVSSFGGTMADIALAFAVLRIGSRVDLGYVIGAREVPTFAASALLLLGIRIPLAARSAGASVLADFREGWTAFVSRRWVVGMVASFGLFQLATFPALLVLGPYVAKTKLGGPISWGTILAVETAGAFVGGALALRLRFGRPLVACLVLSLPTAALLLVVGLAAPVWAISCVAFVNGSCLSMGGAVWFSTLQEKIPEHLISRISSFDWFGSVVFNPIGYVIIGPLSQLVGVAGALYLSAAVNATATLAVLGMPSVRGLRAGPELASDG